MSDVFGDLREWGEVEKKIGEILDRGVVDEHQAGLARILRYRNWRLGQRALEAALAVSQSSDVLIADVQAVLFTEDAPLDVRVLSARALGHLLARRPDQVSTYDPARVVENVRDFVARGGPPLVVKAAEAMVADLQQHGIGGGR